MNLVVHQMLGERCEMNDECRQTPVDGTKICILNRCQCSSGHIPIDAYRCIRDFGLFTSFAFPNIDFILHLSYSRI